MRHVGDDELRASEADWERRVRAAQERWRTPLAVVAEAVARATGAELASSVRLMHGTSNEVYDCTTARGEAVIVRVSHRSVPHFEQERWAIARCRDRGLPVPDVLLVEHRSEGVSISVQRKLSGVPLATVARRWGREDGRFARLISQAGALLAEMHAIGVEGFGDLDGAGRGPLRRWDEFMVDGLAASRAPSAESRAAAEAALAVLRAHRDLFSRWAGRGKGFARPARLLLARQPSRLIHHDFEPSHLLVDDGAVAVTGIIDFEDCKGGDPAYDFAQWDVVHDARAPAAHLAAGYAARAPMTGEFALRRKLGELRFRARQLLEGWVPARDVKLAVARLAAVTRVLA